MEAKDLKNVQNYAYGLEKIFEEAQDFLPINEIGRASCRERV